MLTLERSALRADDRLVVHEPLGTEFPLLAGEVAMANIKPSKPGVYGVGVR
jgi:hypothetical protein